MVYQWTEGARFRIAAQVAGEALDAIREKHAGVLDPSIVVSEARRRNSPLHSCFEWSDQKAGQLHREEQARSLIRSIRVKDAPGNKPRRVYVNVTVPKVGNRYVPATVAMSDAAMRKQVLKEAAGLLQGVKERLADLQNIGAITAALTKLEGEIKKEIRKTGSRKTARSKKPQKRKARTRAATV